MCFPVTMAACRISGTRTRNFSPFRWIKGFWLRLRRSARRWGYLAWSSCVWLHKRSLLGLIYRSAINKLNRVDRLDSPSYDPPMPNQRATNKKQFGLTLTKEVVAAIDADAAKLGITRTDYIREAVLMKLPKEVAKQLKNKP